MTENTAIPIKKIATLYLITIIGYTFLPVHYLPLLKHLSIYFVIAWVVSIIVVPNFFVTRTFIFIVCYLSVVLLNYLNGDCYFSSINYVLDEAAMIPIPLMITYYVLSSSDKKLGRKILHVFFTILIYITIISIIIDNKIHGIIRFGLDDMFVGQRIMDAYYRFGLSNYYMPHALPIIIPPLIMSIKNKNIETKNRTVKIIILLTSLILIYLGGSFGALLLSLFASVLSLLVKQDKSKKNLKRIILTLVIFLPLILSDKFQMQILHFFGGFISSESPYQTKMYELESAISGNASFAVNLLSRNDLLSLSLQSFYENPIWGTNGIVGHHNTLLDRLGVLGLIGFLPYIFIIYFHNKFVIKYIPSNFLIYYSIGVITFLIMLISKSVSYWELWFIFGTILPLSMWLWSTNHNYIHENNSNSSRQ